MPSSQRILLVLGTNLHLRALASSRLSGRGSNLRGRLTESVVVAEEQYTSILTASTLSRLDPLAPTGALVNGLEKAERSTLGVRAVVLAHNRLDSLRGLVGVVEGDGGDVVVEDVGLDDAVEPPTPGSSKDQ